jgi:hypothetical protein
MADRVDLVFRAEGVVEAAGMLRQFKHGLARGVEALEVVVGRLERLGRLPLELEQILKRVDRRNIIEVARINEHPHSEVDPGRVELVHRQGVLPRFV